MKYIKSNTITGEVEECVISAADNAVIDISNDSDDVGYTFKTFADYKYFMDHAKVD